MSWISRDEYASRYGPTVGDRIRLGDTDLWIEIERDHATPGDELRYSFGGTFRPRVLQHASESELDSVVMGAVIVDPLLGVIKGDIGIKDGRIVGIGRAGNPDVMDGVDLVVGPHTSVLLNAHGAIATAGAIDTHVHEQSPRLVPVALASGVTTLITAGFSEPAIHMHHLMRGFEGYPINLGVQPTHHSEIAAHAEQLIADGAVGLKVHEDTGAYPEVIDSALAAAEQHDVAVCLHTDGFNEAGSVADTIDAIGGRALHAYHIEGCGGGHVMDLMALVREPHILCSSTTPTIPLGPSTAAEEIDMILANHEGNPTVADDVRQARERVSVNRLAAEGPLHEMGAIQIINSDSQGMGRIGEVVRRTFQLADVMKRWRASELAEGLPVAPISNRLAGGPTVAAAPADNERVLRYLAKITIEPALTHGISHEVGTLAPGRLADIILWDPRFFGVKPQTILKGGWLAWGQVGEGNASSPLSQPVSYGPWFTGLPDAAPAVSVTFASQLAIDSGLASRLDSRRQFVATDGCRTIRRDHLVANRASPALLVDPVDGTVTLGGKVIRSEPTDRVPLGRRYLLA